MNHLPPDFWERAKEACTPKELEVLKLMAAGYGYRRAAKILSVSPEAVRARRDRARRKIKEAYGKEAA